MPLTVLVCPDPSTICTFTPENLIVGLPPIPDALKLICGRIDSNVC